MGEHTPKYLICGTPSPILGGWGCHIIAKDRDGNDEEVMNVYGDEENVAKERAELFCLAINVHGPMKAALEAIAGGHVTEWGTPERRAEVEAAIESGDKAAFTKAMFGFSQDVARAAIDKAVIAS